MKEIKKVTNEIESEAYKNVEGFDFTKLCFTEIYDVMHDVILRTIDEVEDFGIIYTTQIELFDFSYGVIEERDGKVYPKVDLMINFQDEETGDNYLYRVTFSPYTCTFNKWNKPDEKYSLCDDKLTQCWHIIMKGLFGRNWCDAYNKYCLEIDKKETIDDGLNSI